MQKQENILFTLTGVSGSGKTTIGNALFDDEHTIVSYTTREKRPNEKEGHDYYFVSPDTLRMMYIAGDIVEHMRFNHNEYALAKSEINNKLKHGNCLMVANTSGVEQLTKMDFLKGRIKPVILNTSKAKIKDNLKHRDDTIENINQRLNLYDKEKAEINKLKQELNEKHIEFVEIDTDNLDKQKLINKFKQVMQEF